MFSNPYFTGLILITGCVIFHVVALVFLAKLLKLIAGWFVTKSEQLNHIKKITLLSVAVLFVILTHTIEIIIWALTYIRLGEFTQFGQAVYFSTVTATTLGYGDVTLSSANQLLSGFEAIGGLILFGVSTAFFIQLIADVFNFSDDQ